MLITGVCKHVHHSSSVHRVQFVPLPPAASENGFHEGPWSWQQLHCYHLTDREGWGGERGNIGTRHKQRVQLRGREICKREKKNDTKVRRGDDGGRERWNVIMEEKRQRQKRLPLKLTCEECSCSFEHV